MRLEYRRKTGVLVICVAILMVLGSTAAAGDAPGATTGIEEIPFPINEQLTYAISWSGIRCGLMEITSFSERDSDGRAVYRIAVLMRTTRFFDGIYRVRSRLDSFVDPALMSSIRYEERSLEKKKRKEDVWVVDLEGLEVVRNKNGETTEIPIDVESAFDPLAFIYRLRTVTPKVGEERVFNLMTSKGAVETAVKATEHKTVRTKMGKCDAVAMVPEPRDKMMFSKSGSMVVWIDRQSDHRPCKIEFDLSFGTLVASLRSAKPADQSDIVEDWENWSKEK